jgi:hypothetical protein
MYPIKPYHVAQAKKLGLTIKPSSKKNYKLDVFQDNKYLTSIGDRDYKDYANERRRLYHKRHQNEGIRGKLASFILW